MHATQMISGSRMDAKSQTLGPAMTHFLSTRTCRPSHRFLLEQTCKNEQMARLLKSSKTTIFIDGHRGAPPILRAICCDARVHTCIRHLITNKTMEKMGAVSIDRYAHVMVKLTKRDGCSLDGVTSLRGACGTCTNHARPRKQPSLSQQKA